MSKKFLLTSLLILSVILALGVIIKPAAQAQGAGKEDVLIGFKKFPGNSEKALVEKVRGKIKYTYHLIPVIAASVPSVAIKGLKHNPNVTYVEEDGDVFLDSELTDSWGVDRIDAELAWIDPAGNKGAGVHVAIIDTGIDKDHPDLVANRAGGVNFVPRKGKNKGIDLDAWDDDHGHGTHCAGIVAADDNGFGVVGVAPDAWLYGVKVLDSRGRGKASDFIAGLEWSVDGPDGDHGTPDDAEIISISLTMYDDIGRSVTAACDAAYAAGLVLVASAGNNWGRAVSFPAYLDSVLAVSATGLTDEKEDFFATFSADGPEIELAAPGVDVYSTYKDGGYTTMSGTSMACPHVAGAVALVWATGDYVHGSAVRFQLNETAFWLSGLNSEQQGNGLVYAGAKLVLSPAPAFIVEVSRDNEDYLEGSGEPVILTIMLRDEVGNLVTSIGVEVFEVKLYEYFNPSVEILRIVTIEETEEDGIYTVSFSISDLNVEEDVKYRVVVTATDNGRIGSDEDSFFIIALTGYPLLVYIETDKPDIYKMGEKIYITVTIKYENIEGEEEAVEGVRVYTRIITASGTHYNDEQYTDGDGVVELDRKTKKPNGTGIWRISSRASKSGYTEGWCPKFIEVK